MTIAQTIADTYSNDGQRFTDAGGQSICHACYNVASEMYKANDRELYIFKDGSAIFITDGGWDTVTSDGAGRWISDGWGVVARVDGISASWGDC